MKVSCICIGPLRENCYLIEKENECLLVDPGQDLEAILGLINGKNVKGILVTHYHFDHVASLEELVYRFHYPVYGYYHKFSESIRIGSFLIEVIEVPGHKEDCLCYYFRDEKIMFTGDFLFQSTVGRCDLEGGDEREMNKSIRKIMKYDDDIVIYPGHGDSTVLGIEKMINPFFKVV